MIEDHRRACGEMPLKLSKCRSPWCSPWLLIAALASNTFWLSTCEFFLCQSGLQEDCYSACLSALSGWLLECTEDLSNRVPAWCLPSYPAILLILTSWPFCDYPTAQAVSFLYLQCWQGMDLQQLACFEGCPGTDGIVVRRLSHKWGLSVGETASATSSPERLFLRCSILTLKPTRTAIGTGSLYFWLGGSFFPQHSAGGIETRY